MGLKTLYHKLEDKYFNFLDKLESKGINLYKIIDPLEKKGISTFLLFNIIIIGIIIFLIILLFGSNVNGISDNLMLTFVNPTGDIINNQEFEIMFGDVTKLIKTDSMGVSKVEGLEKDIYELSIVGNDFYIENPMAIDISNENSFKITVSKNEEFISKTLLFSKNGEVVSDLIVDEITCSNNSNYLKEKILVTNGKLILDDLPKDCGNVNVLIYDSSIQGEFLEVSDDQIVGKVYLSDTSNDIGNIKLNFVDSETKQAISNLTISLLVESSKQIIQTIETNNNGIVSFENIPVGEYFVTVYDNSKVYGELTYFDGVIVNIYKDSIESKEISLKKEILGYINLKILDAITYEPISDADIKLKKGTEDISILKTEEDGSVSFGVKDNTATYIIVIDHPNYIKKSQTGILPSDSLKTINLTPVNSDNSKGLIVKVVDQVSNPVEYAFVKLLDNQDNIVISTGKTDSLGQIVFSNLDITKTYKLEANKGKFVSQNSNAFLISERELNEQVLKMEIGDVIYNLKIINNFEEAISTNISVFNFYDNKEILNLKTISSKEGTALLKIRADKDIYFVIDNLESKFITPIYSGNAGEVKELNINLPRTSNSSNIEFIGYFNNKGEQITSVTPGQNVIAKFILNVSKNYTKATAHIRTGKGNSCDNKTYYMDQDDSYIRKISSATNNIFGSKTYTPCFGETTDFSSKIINDGKWFNIEFDNPFIGSYLIEAEIVVLDSAYSLQTINYRSEFYQNNNILRYPGDDILKMSTTNSSKQSLYAYTKEVQIPMGQSNFCNSLLCYSFSIFDKNTGISKNILDVYSAKENNSYRMYFNINILNKSITNPFLKITSSNLNLNEYEIEAPNSVILKGNDFENIYLENLSGNDHFSGYIDFDISLDIDDFINFSLMSDGEIVFSKIINLEVKPSKNLNVEIIPRNFAPFVVSDSIITVTDDSNMPIKDARVNILINNESILTGLTNSLGIYGFILPATDLGDLVKIIITKNEYKKIEQEFLISENLLDVSPENLNITINLSDNFFDSSYITLNNNTLLDLSIDNIIMQNENVYLDYEIIKEDLSIPAGESANILLKTYLSLEGINLEIIKEIKNNILINVSHQNSGKNWTITVPVQTRIIFGNSLDSLDCLLIEPNSYEYRTNDQKIESTFTIKNNCTVSGVSTFLGKLSANLDWGSETPNGHIALVINNINYILEENKEKEILKQINSDQEIDVKLIFTPSETESALREPKITFNSLKVTSNGTEKIESIYNFKTVINRFDSCLKIPDQVFLLACNWFGGMGLYGQLYGNTNRFLNPGVYSYPNYNVGSNSGINYSNGFNPNTYYNPTNNYNYGVGYQTQGYNQTIGNSTLNYSNGYIGNNVTNLNQAQYPNYNLNNGVGLNYSYGYDQYNNYLSPNQYSQTQYSNYMNCPLTSISIENNCAEDIELKIEPNKGVSISDQESIISISRNERKQISLLAGETMGLFNLPVYARADNGLDSDFSYVSEIKANVTLPLSYMPSQCIKVAPQKLDFSGIADYKYKEVEIINTCFDQGYRIVAANILDLNSLDVGGVQYLSVTENLGQLQPIEVHYRYSDKQTGAQYEAWKIALKRNPEVRNTDIVKDYLAKYGTSVAGVVTSVRKLLFDTDEVVNLKFMLNTSLQAPNLQTPIMQVNTGMELTDNWQWLGFLDGGLFDWFNSKDIEISEIVEEGIEYIYEDANLDYSVKSFRGEDVVFIHVPEIYLTKDKFRPLDDETSSQLCFVGKVNDFPISNIADHSFISEEVSSMFYNNSGPVRVSIDFPKRPFFRLCFERPNTEIKEKEATVYDKFNDKFNLLELLDSGKSRLQGEILIGVDAKLESGKVDTFDNVEEKDETVEIKIAGKVFVVEKIDGIESGCIDPKLTETDTDNGKTGSVYFEEYGLDRLLFNWDYSDIDTTTCEGNNYYCDQEQLLMSITRKIEKDKDSTITLNGINFEIDKDGEIVSTDKNSNNCSKCKDFRKQLEKANTIDEYVEVSKQALKDIVLEESDFSLIKVEKTDNNVLDTVKKIVGNNYYEYTKNSKNYIVFTVSDYISKLDDLSNIILNNTEGFTNMINTLEVFTGSSINVFKANIKMFGDLNSSNNKAIFEKKDIFNRKYTFEVATSGYQNISEPGVYEIKIVNVSDDGKVTIEFVKEKPDTTDFTSQDKKYSENVFFYNPINPNTFTGYKAPFVNNAKKVDNITSVWGDLQKGYIFKFANKDNTELAKESFFDSRLLFLNTSSESEGVVYSVGTLDNVFAGNYNVKSLYILNNYKAQSGYDYQLFLLSENNLTSNPTNLLIKDVSGKYLVPANNTNIPNLDLGNMENVINYIKSGQVCYESTQQEIKLWINPKLSFNN
ncbi:MAG: hypothetical protein PHR26_00185 [Candidatus ainarchaeum sp.]|nr:hypothetical protein [Candidatus ainarchaeum sp.]